MVMEIAGHGDLLEYVRLRGALNEEKAKFMFAQLVSAVDYMHGFNVVHRWQCNCNLLNVVKTTRHHCVTDDQTVFSVVKDYTESR